MKLKKILYTNLFFLMLITNLYSNFNIDISGVVSGGGDTGTLYGAAYGISCY
jgi:hypothetical protein